MIRTALIIEEDHEAENALTQALSGRGYEVICESDLKSAMMLLDKWVFDLAVIGHAGREGDLVSRLRALPAGRALPILCFRPQISTPEQQEKLHLLRWPPETTELDARLGSPPSRTPAMQGSLSDSPVPALLAHLAGTGAEGALVLKRDHEQKVVYFKAGEPVSVRSNRVSECLGQLLVRSGNISKEICEESLRAPDKLRQGERLVRMGELDPRKLKQALHAQLRYKLYQLFAWHEGTFEFLRGISAPTTVRLRERPAALIWKGIQKSYRRERLKRLLRGHADELFVPVREPKFASEDLRLSEEERAAVLWLRTEARTLAEISRREPIEQMLQMVYALDCLGLFQFEPKPGRVAAAENVVPEPRDGPERKRPTEIKSPKAAAQKASPAPAGQKPLPAPSVALKNHGDRSQNGRAERELEHAVAADPQSTEAQRTPLRMEMRRLWNWWRGFFER